MSAASSSRVLAAARSLPRRPRAELARTYASAELASSKPTRPPPPPRSSASETTPADASAYLSSLLSLPSHAAFPPALALQILTHKSYRFVHRIAHPPPYTAAELAHSQADHNARLAFLGRRALAAYTAMFVHSALPSSAAVRGADFLRGQELQEKLDNLRHANNLGRKVGDVWGVGDVMRWDQAETGREGGHSKIKGLTVEAILGGVFSHLGSPAAQRAFHLHVLPLLAPQLRDPLLQEAAERVRASAKELGVAQ